MILTDDYLTASKYFQQNKIGIIPTDTIYGISCLASNVSLVEKIYTIKGRDLNKPFIILISKLEDLLSFNVTLSEFDRSVISKYWPGPVSIIFDVNEPSLSYLHRNTFSLSFRLPSKPKLLELVSSTGPLVSTSANISSQVPITNLKSAQEVFDNKVDFFLDEGDLDNPPSKIIKLQNNEEIIIRG